MRQKQILNQINERLNIAAANNESLTLNAIEVKALAEEMDDILYIPVLTMEELVELSTQKKD